MNYFAVDIGGSSIKYAVMIEEMHFLKKGKAERACAILMDLIAGKEVQKENIISVSLVERDSTR